MSPKRDVAVATGSSPSRARPVPDLRRDLALKFSGIAGYQKYSRHLYGETTGFGFRSTHPTLAAIFRAVHLVGDARAARFGSASYPNGRRIASSRPVEACCATGGGTSMNDPVDVLIIGAGASGAAVAWSLADTKMHILCLEQGGWMNPADYPSTGPRLGGAVLGRLFAQPQHPRAARGLSDQRRQLADQGREFQRRRRQHDLLHRAFPAPASVRFPGQDARRRRRRLADRLRHAWRRSSTRTTG